MSAITTNHGKHFEAAAGETLLAAALRNGITLDYSCRTGRCSSCKGQVRSGQTIAIHDELGLTEDERNAGWILTCVREAVSDVELDVDDLGDVKLFPAKTLPCRIHSMEKLAADVLRVTLRLPPNSDFSYRAGQYIDVIGVNGLRRSYSIANASRADKLIDLHIREVDSGEMSRFWFEQAKPNDLLRLNGPLGTFFLREVAGRDLIFLATGTGIAPVKAMLESMCSIPQELKPSSISVYWGGRKPEDIYWNLGSIDIPLIFVSVLSRADSAWQGRRGHVQDVLLADQPLLAHSVVYACGSDSMIHAARDLLTSNGLPLKSFHSDAFVCSAST